MSRCCLCLKSFIEIHHIAPPSAGGFLKDIDNAAPLCEKCHGDFGDNPKKRKAIKRCRDDWYEVVAALKSADRTARSAALETLSRVRDTALAKHREDEETVVRVTDFFAKHLEGLPAELNGLPPDEIADGIWAGVDAPGNVFVDEFCATCGDRVHRLLNSNYCPHCRGPFRKPT